MKIFILFAFLVFFPLAAAAEKVRTVVPRRGSSDEENADGRLGRERKRGLWDRHARRPRPVGPRFRSPGRPLPALS